MIDTFPSNPHTLYIIRVLSVMLMYLILWPLFSLALSCPVQLLWNWLMPAVFGLPVISFWQAAGLMLLVSILFRWSVSFKTNETYSA